MTTETYVTTATPEGQAEVFLAAVQADAPGTRLMLLEMMGKWQQLMDAMHGARAIYEGNREAGLSAQECHPDFMAWADASRAWGSVSERLLLHLVAWERVSDAPLPGVIDPLSSQRSFLTIERDCHGDVRVVRRYFPLDPGAVSGWAAVTTERGA